MKYFVLLCDGMADMKCPELGNMTPMEAAHKPTMDHLARYSLVGRAKTVPDGMKPGSDPANLAVMSYDPAIYSNGRSPLEAASMGLEMTESMTAFRCNVLTLSDGDEPYEEKTMIDHGADDITTEEANVLIKAVEEALSDEERHFYTGISYRHCLLWDNAPEIPSFTPPHDILGRKVTDYLPSGEAGEIYLDLMKKSYDILNHHPVNEARRERGLHPANSIWLWSPGKKPALPDFYEKWGLRSTVISAVDLIKGIAKCANMESVDVEGATGNFDTNYKGKADAAIEAFERGQDYVYVHVEAPDECGHRGEAENKKRCIELIDENILKPVFEYLKKQKKPYKIMVLPDHPTPICKRTHTGDPVPFLIYYSEAKWSGVRKFTEESAEKTGVYVPKGWRLMELLTKGYLPEYGIKAPAVRTAMEFFELLAISLIAVMLLMTFAARHSPVIGSSMEDTLIEDDVLFISELYSSLETGDIVIIQHPSQPEEPLVKRVIATEGQTFRIDYNNWEITVDGTVIDSSYVYRESGEMRSFFFARPDENGVFEDTVPEGMIFVLGDHRNVSKDSRSLGYMDERYVIGKVKFRFLPLNKFKTF